jgi:hypothetical protein
MIADLSGPSPAVRRVRFAAIGAVLFTASLAIGTWSGYRLIPSLVVGLAAIYATYFVYLSGIVHAREGSEVHRLTNGARKGRARAVVDRWMGVETGQIGWVHPGSTDTKMHVELGTLSPARVTERATPVQGHEGEHDRRRAG